MIRVIACLAVILLSSGASSADIKVVVANDGSERLVIANVTDRMLRMAEQQLIMLDGKPTQLMDVAKCDDFGSRMIAEARAEPFTMNTMMAQYNAVSLWLGRVCEGKSDVLPTPEQGRAWLEEVATIKAPGGKPLIDSHKMKAMFLMFGAPGIQADPAEAMAYVAPKAEADPAEWGLYMAYLYQEGIGALADEGKAVQWIEKAADKGNTGARLMRAQAMELGLWRERNEAEAFKTYTDIGWTEGEFRAGLMLLEGRGVPRDACKAKAMLQASLANVWTSVVQAKPYIDRIEAEALCHQ